MTWNAICFSLEIFSRAIWLLNITLESFNNVIFIGLEVQWMNEYDPYGKHLAYGTPLKLKRKYEEFCMNIRLGIWLIEGRKSFLGFSKSMFVMETTWRAAHLWRRLRPHNLCFLANILGMFSNHFHMTKVLVYFFSIFDYFCSCLLNSTNVKYWWSLHFNITSITAIRLLPPEVSILLQ